MFVACHLFLGLVLGLAFAGRLDDRRLIGFSALGAVLPPDLIDKPVGHLILAGSLNSGRLFGHGLLFLMLLTVAGITLYRRHESIALLAVAAGALSHQILDAMWAIPPVTWYFPLLGPYEPYEFTDYFGGAIFAEVSSLSEWIFLAASAGIALAACRSSGSGISRFAAALVRVSVPLLGILALVSLLAWAAGSPESILMAGAGPEDYLLLAVVAAVGGVVGAIRHRDYLYAG
ncbi:metal-dependent hydrolase [Methanoculleus chikugoensis]|uniref:metal-dependent hydrolase n=1 Tax=Methanoculleus chikugoensis TaxID=118126 RepID=UPI0006D21BE8|nr:metal-dependent hydrolase [Methanoculleus chikugoensis]